MSIKQLFGLRYILRHDIRIRDNRAESVGLGAKPWGEKEDRTMELNDQKQWYAIRTFHNKATTVCRIAEREEVEWYTPIREEELLEGGEVVVRHTPLMPSLLFLRANEGFIARLRVETQDNILPYCEPGTAKPKPIADDEMELFRFVATTAARSLEPVDEKLLTQGSRVRITGGVFEGKVGYIVRVRGDRRFVVSIKGVATIATTYVPKQFICPIVD